MRRNAGVVAGECFVCQSLAVSLLPCSRYGASVPAMVVGVLPTGL
jgi:hypothetical protein